MKSLGLLCLCGLALAQSPPPQLNLDGLRATIRAAVSDGSTPSMAVAVARNGRMVWSEGFGFADRETRAPSAADVPYSVASVTKPFTATALMILLERQRVALDQPIEKHLGPLDRHGVAAPDDVTLRRVLGHVGGFPPHYQYFFDDRPDRPLPFADRMRCYGTEFLRPGRYTYSNLGFGALSEVVTRVSGQSYRDFLAQEVFAPLGLKRASVPERASEATGAATRYGRDGRPLPFFVTDFEGGSALYASAEDLARFGSFHAGAPMDGQRAVLTPASIAAMQQPGAGDYGLGWSINRSWNRHTVIWHSGAMPGASATLWLVPAEKIAIAVVANQIMGPVNQIAGEILAELLPGGAPPAPSPAPVAATQASPTTRPVPASPAGRYRGSLMACPKAEPLTIEIESGREIRVTLGTAAATSLENVDLDGTMLGGGFAGPNGTQYRLYLRLSGSRLEGPVTRRVSLGPRATVAVTLWAQLEPVR
jgi:CubicO group peptidase (beta-lactamase class C family)